MTDPYEGWFICPVCPYRGDAVWMLDVEMDVEYAVCPECDEEIELGK